MTSKTKNKLKWIPSCLAAVIISGSAIAKLAGVPQLVQSFSDAGILIYMRPFAIAELLFVTLFLFRTSMPVGFLLLTAYYGGAIAVEVVNNGIFAAPIMILAIVWLAAFLRNPSIFKSMTTTGKLNVA